MKWLLDNVLTGSVAPIGPRSAPSGIAKTPVVGKVHLRLEGLIGDAQGDTRNHGGPEKALHHYAYDHYAHWRQTLGERPVLQGPGAFGENLTTTGAMETSIAVGDTFRLGTAIIQVSQGRQPCWKLNIRFDVADMALRVQSSGMTGWYYRVIQPGAFERGDEIILVDRLSPEWTIERIRIAFYVDMMNADELAGICQLDHLPEKWRDYARKRLQSGRIEDWSKRLSAS